MADKIHVGRIILSVANEEAFVILSVRKPRDVIAKRRQASVSLSLSLSLSLARAQCHLFLLARHLRLVKRVKYSSTDAPRAGGGPTHRAIYFKDNIARGA
jgi:hypothetical protein